MATYHLRVKTISRGQGQSAVAAAAYRSGEKLTDEATGRIRDYADRAGRVQFAGIFVPFGAPAWARDRATLWNAVERVERRRDATLAREIELSLPHELTDRQRLQLVRDFVREHLVRRGLAVDVAIHAPEQGGDPRNFHAHLLIAERQLGPRGFAAVKDRGLQRKATLHGWRAGWAKLCNRYLAAHGHAARVDHRSFRARCVTGREPTRSLGPVAAAMQRRGVVTPRGARLAAVQARNALRQAWREVGTVGRPAAVPLPREAAATGHRSAGIGKGNRPAPLSGVVVARMPAALASLAVAESERFVREAAGEVCRRAETDEQGRDLLPARVSSFGSGEEAEPCSYEAEVQWIVRRYARQIDGIRAFPDQSVS